LINAHGLDILQPMFLFNGRMQRIKLDMKQFAGRFAQTIPMTSVMPVNDNTYRLLSNMVIAGTLCKTLPSVECTYQ